MDCLGFILKHLKDVKQHLQRKHYQHLPKCPTFGLDTTEHDNHVRGPRAGAETVAFTRKIRLGQQQRLQAIVFRAGSSKADTRVEVWHTLFDDAHLPGSPWQKITIEELADVVKTIWAKHEIDITRGIGAELPSSQALLRQSLPVIFSKTLHKLFEKLEKAISNASRSEAVFSEEHDPTSFDANMASGAPYNPISSRR